MNTLEGKIKEELLCGASVDLIFNLDPNKLEMVLSLVLQSMIENEYD